ncbi:hypothetical protein [Pseudoalteromonas phage PH357]|nr:hypothetical protein [Pseudoalteromonas phage PH357]
MDITQRDYTSYIDLLPEQFSQAENTKKLLEIFLNEDQVFFDELIKLFEVGLDLETATGYQLDVIGKLAGEERDDRTDEQYREAIKFKQFINNSSGTIPELLSYLKTITNSEKTYLYEHYPATVCMEVDGDAPSAATVELTDQSAAGGVDVHSIIHSPDGVAMRPVSVNEAFDNYNSGTDTFSDITDKTDPLYYAQRPSANVYVSSRSLAARTYMSAGNHQAVATGLTLTDPTIDKGKHPEVYVREEQE